MFYHIFEQGPNGHCKIVKTGLTQDEAKDWVEVMNEQAKLEGYDSSGIHFTTDAFDDE